VVGELRETPAQRPQAVPGRAWPDPERVAARSRTGRRLRREHAFHAIRAPAKSLARAMARL
jgi:hypothetical protein